MTGAGDDSLLRLDGVHTVFGRTTDMAVVNSIKQGDKIVSVKIVE